MEGEHGLCPAERHGTAHCRQTVGESSEGGIISGAAEQGSQDFRTVRQGLHGLVESVGAEQGHSVRRHSRKKRISPHYGLLCKFSLRFRFGKELRDSDADSHGQHGQNNYKKYQCLLIHEYLLSIYSRAARHNLHSLCGEIRLLAVNSLIQR